MSGLEYYSPTLIHSSESQLEIDGRMFSLRQRADYDDNGDIVKLTEYKPEGVLEHAREEPIKDSQVLKELNFPFQQNWIYSKKTGLLKNGKKQDVAFINARLLISKKGNTAIFYKLDSLNNSLNNSLQ